MHARMERGCGWRAPPRKPVQGTGGQWRATPCMRTWMGPCTHAGAARCGCRPRAPNHFNSFNSFKVSSYCGSPRLAAPSTAQAAEGARVCRGNTLHPPCFGLNNRGRALLTHLGQPDWQNLASCPSPGTQAQNNPWKLFRAAIRSSGDPTRSRFSCLVTGRERACAGGTGPHAAAAHWLQGSRPSGHVTAV
jgi:hypothetical protein